MNTCPKCDSSKLRPSRPRGLQEGVLKFINYQAYRCKECGWRGILRAPKIRPLKPTMTLPHLIIVVVALVFGLWILIRLLPSE